MLGYFVNTNCNIIGDAYILNSYYPCKNNNYLQFGKSYWTMSPHSLNYVWFTSNAGYIYTSSADTSNGVYPALFLKSDINLSGSGTQTEPYIIN